MVVPNRHPAEYNVGEHAQFEVFVKSNSSAPCSEAVLNSVSFGVEFFKSDGTPVPVVQMVNVNLAEPLRVGAGQQVKIGQFDWDLYDGPPPNGRPIAPGDYTIRVSLVNNYTVWGQTTITMLPYGQG